MTHPLEVADSPLRSPAISLSSSNPGQIVLHTKQ